MIRSPYEPVQSEKREIADEVNLDAETPGKDNDQPIQSPQDLKSGPQELTVTNSPRTEEKMCTFGPICGYELESSIPMNQPDLLSANEFYTWEV